MFTHSQYAYNKQYLKDCMFCLMLVSQANILAANRQLTVPLANIVSLTIDHSETRFVKKPKTPVFEQPYC